MEDNLDKSTVVDNKSLLIYELLKEVLTYDSDTGIFVWKISPNRGTKIGDVAASLNKSTGYIRIQYSNRSYLAHRLAWVYIYGEIKDAKFIDHINRVRSDNRIINLRLCTPSENQKNRKLNLNSKSGYKGVHWCESRQKWRVQVQISRNLSFTQYYNIKEDAIEAHKDICIRHHREFFNDTTLAIM